MTIVVRNAEECAKVCAELVRQCVGFNASPYGDEGEFIIRFTGSF